MLLFLGSEIRHTVTKATTFDRLGMLVGWGLAYEMLIKQITYIRGDVSLENVGGLIEITGKFAQHVRNCTNRNISQNINQALKLLVSFFHTKGNLVVMGLVILILQQSDIYSHFLTGQKTLMSGFCQLWKAAQSIQVILTHIALGLWALIDIEINATPEWTHSSSPLFLLYRLSDQTQLTPVQHVAV